jgi:hypothetical protein
MEWRDTLSIQESPKKGKKESLNAQPENSGFLSHLGRPQNKKPIGERALGLVAA